MKLIDQLVEAIQRRRDAEIEVQRLMKDIQKKSDGRSTRSYRPRRKKVVAKAE
jgi:hypothetical protein